MKFIERDKSKIIKQIRIELIKELKNYDVMRRCINGISVDVDRRIKLPKEFEDALLFDYFKDSEGKTYKKFAIIEDLCKIDLSEVGMEDVDFNQKAKKVLDLSYSNLKVDFSKTYQAKNGYVVEVSNVDFSHMDLSDSKHDVFAKKYTPTIIFRNCSLSFTNFKIINGEEIEFISCLLGNNDLSDLKDIELDGHSFASGDRLISFNGNCDLINTKLNIRYDGSVFECDKKFLKETLGRGYLNGCFINGKAIWTKYDWHNAGIKAKENYTNFLNAEAQNVINEIREQMVKPKKKKLVQEEE